MFCSLLRERRGERGLRLLRGRARRHGARRAGVPAAHAGAGDAPVRRRRRRGRDHRLRAALPPVRPPVLPEPAGAHGAARSPAARACALRVRPARDYGGARPPRRPGARTTCATSAAISCCALTTDCSITAILEETPFVLREPFSLVLGPDETLQGSVAERRAALPRADRRLLAGLGARPVDSLRMAGRDHPRRHHAEARRLRRHRRDRRRARPPRFPRPRTAAATGTTATAGCATPTSSSTRSTASTRRAPWSATCGYIINVAAARRRHAAAGVRHQRPARTGRARGRLAARLSRHGAGARRQPGLPAGAERRLRLGGARGDARVLRPAADRRSATRRCSASSNRSASAPSPRTTSPTPASGSCAARRACTRSPASCAGPPATGWPRSPRACGLARARALLARARRRASTRVICARAWNAQRGSFVATFDGDALDASLLLLDELGFLRADDPRFAATVAAVERELKRGDFVFRYVERGRLRRARQRLPRLHVLVHRRAGRARPARRGARAVRGHARAAQSAWACSPSTSIRRRGELWGNFPQTYSMVGHDQLRDAPEHSLGPGVLRPVCCASASTSAARRPSSSPSTTPAASKSAAPRRDAARRLRGGARRHRRAGARGRARARRAGVGGHRPARRGVAARPAWSRTPTRHPYNGMPLKPDLERLLGRELRFENDANCFALSEAPDGAARGVRVVFGAILGTGAGGGIVVRRPRAAPAPTRSAASGATTRCPGWSPASIPARPATAAVSGCIERFVSRPGARGRPPAARRRASSTPRRSRRAPRTANGLQGDPSSATRMRLARALAHVVNLLDPEVIVLGGGLVEHRPACTWTCRSCWGAYIYARYASQPVSCAPRTATRAAYAAQRSCGIADAGPRNRRRFSSRFAFAPSPRPTARPQRRRTEGSAGTGTSDRVRRTNPPRAQGQRIPRPGRGTHGSTGSPPGSAALRPATTPAH